MALAENFARFADKLREVTTGLMSEITMFPSGAVSLRVRFTTNRVFDLEYFPSHQLFCVDELPEDAGFNTAYRFSYPDFESARAKLLALLEEARNGPAQRR
jgi:hypothetical protein